MYCICYNLIKKTSIHCFIMKFTFQFYFLNILCSIRYFGQLFFIVIFFIQCCSFIGCFLLCISIFIYRSLCMFFKIFFLNVFFLQLSSQYAKIRIFILRRTKCIQDQKKNIKEIDYVTSNPHELISFTFIFFFNFFKSFENLQTNFFNKKFLNDERNI